MKKIFPRMTQEPTYYFVDTIHLSNLSFVLEKIYHITEYKKYGERDFPKVLPSNLVVPKVKALPWANDQHFARRVAVVISHINADDLHDILFQILDQRYEKLEKQKARNNRRVEIDYLRSQVVSMKYHTNKVLEPYGLRTVY